MDKINGRGDDAVTSATLRASIDEGRGDAAGSTATTARIEVGDRFSGRIGGAADTDWIRIDLTAGQTYVFSAFGTGGSANGIDDTILRVRGSDGTLLATHDDIDPGHGNFFSALTYTARTTGTYYIEVASYGSETGTYTLQTATNLYTPEQVASQLTELSWGFPTLLRFDLSNGRTISYNVDGLTADGQRLARLALDAWSAVTGISFVAAGATAAQILFDDNQSGAFAGPTAFNPNTGIISRASVNVSTQWLATYGTAIDGYTFQTYVHEIGHALGLGHAGNYDGSARYPGDALYRNDSYQMSVMSYFSVGDNSFVRGVDGAVITPMLADIIGMDLLYGNSTAHAGNTVWGANSNVPGYLGQLFGILFDGDTAPRGFYNGGDVMFTIHDTGGTDTIDLSTVGAGSRIDLRPGTFSDIGAGPGNDFAIGTRSVIENAIGGAFADDITGNSVSNRIYGGGGNDTMRGEGGSDRLYGAAGADVLYGGSGADYLYGGSGTDTLYGGSGSDWIVPGLGNDVIFGGADNDTIVYSDSPHGMVIDLGAGRATGAGGEVDTFSSIEHAMGSRLDDTLIGDDGANRLRGLNGRDLFIATPGADTYDGGGATDMVSYERATGPVTVNLTTGRGSGGLAEGHRYIDIERIRGSDFNDTLTGSDARDLLSGGNGDDFIFATGSNDLHYGGLGNDTVDYGRSTAGVEVYLNLSRGSGGLAEGHGYTSIENLNGSAHDDRLQGTNSANRLVGRAGNDTLRGYGGDDVLFGGAGDDRFFGDEGNDRFYGGPGDDRIFGGAGRDQAHFTGARSEYTITVVSASEVRVAHTGGTQADGIDTLFSTELLIFSDQTVFL